jgi:hypothetical protein
MLVEGGVIGWQQGRSEFGLRSLGDRSGLAVPRPAENKLERLSTEWRHSVDKKSRNCKELEHVLSEKGGQVFPNML